VVEKGNVDYSSKVKLGDCLELVKEIKDGTISLVLTDPPYGINLDEGETKKGNLHPTIYSDNPGEIMDLVREAAREAYRVLKQDTHAYFWFDIKAYPIILQHLSEAGFVVDPVPLIWAKNTPGQTNHPESRWASGYEVCFFCRKGKRPLLKQGRSNVLNYPTVPPAQKIHPVEKPYSLLRQLIEASTVDGEVVLDMFGGSGSTAEAAIRSGRDFITFEKDPAFHAGIIERLSRIEVTEGEEVKVDMPEDINTITLSQSYSNDEDEDDIEAALERHIRK
jgi:site-specific DNA-methyltransferase (adenine-specific)